MGFALIVHKVHRSTVNGKGRHGGMKRLILRSLGVAAVLAGGVAMTATPAQADWNTGYNAGLGSGNQISSIFQLPISACGNSIAIFGFSSASCGGGAYAYNGNSGSGQGANLLRANRWNRWR